MMTNRNLTRRVLTLLNCATSLSEAEHICENPVVLSCGHYICKDCLRSDVNHTSIKCNICGETNKRDLSQEEKPHAFNLLFEQNLDDLSNVFLENFRKTFKTCNEMIYNYEERIDNHVQFIKDNILIRIESIKMELDNLYETLNNELDDMQKKWKMESKDIKFEKFDAKIFENELKEFEENIKERKSLSQDNLYKYQKQLRQIQQIIKEYKNITPTLEFIESEEKLKKQVIGELIYQRADLDDRIIERIKLNKYEKINVQYQPSDLFVLPNGNSLLSNYSNSNLQLYDANMQHIRTITSINGIAVKTFGIATDDNNTVFMSTLNTHCVIKTDLNFNQSATFGTGSSGSAQNQLSNPRGVCFYNQSVYVCDCSNNRIQKLDSNLSFQASLVLNYMPWYIKNIKNVAIVRSYSTSSIYFYDLNTFNELKRYDGHNGVIVASKNYFYEYFSNNKTFYCYKNNGELVEQIQTNGQGLTSDNNWSSMCFMNGKILATVYGSNYLTII